MDGRDANEVSGAPERIRTSDLCLRRAALYPAELRAQKLFYLLIDRILFINAALRSGNAHAAFAASLSPKS